MAGGTAMDKIDGVVHVQRRPEARLYASLFLLTPTAITKDNLNEVIDGGWITKEEACKGVKPAPWTVRLVLNRSRSTCAAPPTKARRG